MRNIDCMVIDKNEKDADVLSQYINNIPFFNLSGRYTAQEKAAGILKSQEIDMLFIDIEDGGVNCLDTLQSLSYHTRVVITTNQDHFALQAFELNVLDYLLKPLQGERFRQAAD